MPTAPTKDRVPTSTGRRARERAFSVAKLGPLELRNRIIKSATFEGMCPRGTPSEALIEHHRAIAAGGAAMSTVAYCSVSPEGRSYDSQMWIRPEILPILKRLSEAVHQEGAAASLQIGHCGYFADQQVAGRRPLAPSRLFNTYGLSFSRAMNDGDLKQLREQFARAATLAIEAGFDCIELHGGHGYLLSQFLSPFTNRRKDDYGGSLENRLRFPLSVVRAMRDAIGTRAALIIKMNLRDGFPGGLELDEAIHIAQAFENESVDGLVLSGGFVSKNPMYIMRGEVPLKAMVSVQDRWFRKLGLWLFGRIFVEAFPYRDLYFLDEARKLRQAVKLPLALLGGVRTLSHIETAMREGFDFVAMARALICDPDLINKMKTGLSRASACIPCNRCIAEMDRGGVRCVLEDAEGGQLARLRRECANR